MSPEQRSRSDDADVVVVGGGPAGSTAATYLARAGLDVLVLEKAEFPREKVCGDGVTPRGVRQLLDLGIDTRPEAGWVRNKGLRVSGGGASIELDWPDLTSYPDYGLVRPRRDFDQMLADHARAAGARVQERTLVTGATRDERTGRVTGVEAKVGPEKTEKTYRAPLVLACDGVGARTAVSVGTARRDDRPLGVAVRRYYTTPTAHDEYLGIHFDVWDRLGATPVLVGGYGWVFPMGDGTANVGLGVLSQRHGHGDYRALMRAWVDELPAEWELSEDTATGPIGGAALPMGLSRTPVYRDGLLLVGDAGGVVNPFSGEGIAYAMETARMAAEHVLGARARADGERVLDAYPQAVAKRFGSYYRLGNHAAHAFGRPHFMHYAVRHGLPRGRVMRPLLRLFAGLHDPGDADATGRAVDLLLRLTPQLKDAQRKEHARAA